MHFFFFFFFFFFWWLFAGHDPNFANKKITLLESSPEKEFELPTTYKNRVSTVNPASVSLLDSKLFWFIQYYP